jgi:predicted HTH domain antitoxin
MEEQDGDARLAAVRLVSRGLITPGEAAQLAGVSRQLVNYWLRRRDVEWQDRYHERLGKMWRKELDRGRARRL